MVTLINKSKLPDGRLRVVVNINGNDFEYFAISLDSLKTQVRSEVERQNSVSQLDQFLIPGGFDYIDQVVTPTQAEIDRRTFFDDYNKYQRVMDLVNLGLVPANNAKVIALKNKVISEFKPEYLDL